jgi:hypothetical protein
MYPGIGINTMRRGTWFPDRLTLAVRDDMWDHVGRRGTHHGYRRANSYAVDFVKTSWRR